MMENGKGKLVYITEKGEKEILPDDYLGPLPEPVPEPQWRSIRKRKPFIAARFCPDRAKRRRAWIVIFEELGAETLPERLAVARRVVSIAKDYEYDKLHGVDRRGAKKRNGVIDSRKRAALKLANLIENNPEDDWSIFLAYMGGTGKNIWDRDTTDLLRCERDELIADLVETLKAIANAGTWKPFQKPDETNPFSPFGYFHTRLARLYVERTGREPTRGVHWDTKKSIGPYVRFLQAAFNLVGEQHSVEHTIKTLQKHLAAAGKKIGQ